MASATFNQVSTPIVDLMKDVTGLAALYLILNAMFPNWSKGLDLEALDATNEKGWMDYFETQNLLGAAAGGAAAGFAGGSWFGPWGAAIGAVAGAFGGTLAVEGGEQLVEDVKVPAVRGLIFMLQLRRVAKEEGLVE